MTATRDAERTQFLAESGWGEATLVPLAGDASFRRYFRLKGERPAVLMDAPPPLENVRPFMAIAAVLAAHGYSTPKVLAGDAGRGFLVLEDLGDRSFNRELAAGGDERALYEAAIDLLLDLRARAVPATVPPFDDDRILREVGFILEWFWPAFAGRRASAAMTEEYLELWRSVLPAMRADTDALALFDYHVDNLMWLPQRGGIARVGLLDFQDAVRGPAAYDVVSLLEDARRDVPAPIVAGMIERYCRHVPNRRDFMTAYAATGAQRNARIVGVFARLWLRDAKPQYLSLLPRVWGLLERDLAHPVLAPLRSWFDRHVAVERRRSAPRPEELRLPS
jgi:aminoglycoside/choline kinase family phosphotransferase